MTARPDADAALALLRAEADDMAMWSRIVVVESCWEWTGYRNPKGYGRVHWRGRSENAHRVMYALRRGPIPPGLTLDHLCRNRACVNPDHLEPVTNRVNVLRGAGSPARYAARTHCDRGHPLVGLNVRHEADRRVCLACQKIRNDRSNKRRSLPAMAAYVRARRAKARFDTMTKEAGDDPR